MKKKTTSVQPTLSLEEHFHPELRASELREIFNCTKNTDKHIISIFGPPGTGKTSLISHMSTTPKYFKNPNLIIIYENILRVVQSTPISLLVLLKRRLIETKHKKVQSKGRLSFDKLVGLLAEDSKVVIVLDEIDKLSSDRSLSELATLLTIAQKLPGLKVVTISNDFVFLQKSIPGYSQLEESVLPVPFAPFDAGKVFSLFVNIWKKAQIKRGPRTLKRLRRVKVTAEVEAKIQMISVRATKSKSDLRYGFSELTLLLENKREIQEKSVEVDIELGEQTRNKEFQEAILGSVEEPLDLVDICNKLRKLPGTRKHFIGLTQSEVFDKIEMMELMGLVKISSVKGRKIIVKL